MKTNTIMIRLVTALMVIALFLGMIPANPVQAANTATTISLTDFIAAVKSSNPSRLTGIFVKDVLANRVVQQSSPDSVSSVAGTVTQFGLASEYGTIGLLAHNYLAGSNFSNLQAGVEITLVFGNGQTKTYKVTAIKTFQALSPTDPYSKFVNLENPEKTLSSTELFKQIYGSSGNLILQTCIAKDGISSWGRLFVIASPVD